MKKSSKSKKKNIIKTKSSKREVKTKKKIMPPKLQAVLDNDKKGVASKQNALDRHLEKSNMPQVASNSSASQASTKEKPTKGVQKSGATEKGNGKSGESKKTEVTEKSKAKEKQEQNRDLRKFIFNGVKLGKGPFVLAVVKHYLQHHKAATVAELKKVFPDELVTRYGVFTDLKTATEKSKEKKRYFINPEQLLEIGGKKYAVTNQITAAVMEKFLEHLKKRGLKQK